MKSEVITLVIVHDVIYVLLRYRCVDHQVAWNWEWGCRGVDMQERVKGEVSPDTMRAWIRYHHVLESAGSDLIIVGGVTPTTDTGTRIIEEFGVVKVSRV